MIENLSRRNFLSRGSAAVSAVWLSAHWPAIVAAAEHAHRAAKSSAPPKFQFFTPEEAVEIDAIAARIIPSDETPGDRKSTRLNSSHANISYAVFCLKKKKRRSTQT